MNPYNFTTEDRREMTGVSIEFLIVSDQTKRNKTIKIKSLK
jgi:hypothetical protein